MDDPDEYIEAYFKDQLNDAEKKQFEERCVHDEAFAKEVAFYVTLNESIRQELLEQKKQQWTNAESGTEGNRITLVKKMMNNKWRPYLAAACLLFAIGLYFLYMSETPKQFANKYVKDHFIALSQTMNASNDSLQRAIAAYNNKDYNTALHLFEELSFAQPRDGVAKKYVGLVYLVTNNYPKALVVFDELAGMKGLYNNPGLFLKAITLLVRDNNGDMAKAKLLLEQVVNEKADGSREAEKWLRKW